MKMFVISDNMDTFIGLKLVGVNGVILHKKEDIEKTLKSTASDKSIGVIIVTKGIVELAKEIVDEIKIKNGLPLIVEISDRHGDYSSAEDIEKYINRSIGL
ncbi:MAG: V-type ATP synthase subunit F [Oscillospiraceae bacterium]|nr:V-type ATP synthase subunit F [Oscillospiraceae bacterium]